MSRTTIAEFLEREHPRLVALELILAKWLDADLFNYKTDHGPLTVWAVDIQRAACDSLALINAAGLLQASQHLLLFKNVGPGVNVAPVKGRILSFSVFAQHAHANAELWQALVALFRDYVYDYP